MNDDGFDACSLLTGADALGTGRSAQSLPPEAPQPVLKRSRTRTPMDEAQVVVRNWRKVKLEIERMEPPERTYVLQRVRADLEQIK